MYLKRALLVSCLALGTLFAQGNPKDDHIYDQVRLKLASDVNVNGGGIEVTVHDGVVTLKGKVHRDKQKQRAEKVAKKVKGVTNVVNELRVENP